MNTEATEVVPDFANSIRLSGTTGSDRTAELTQGHWYTVYVGATPVCIIDGDDVVDAVVGRPILGAYTAHSFLLDRGNGHIACISADATTAWTVDVVPSSPRARQVSP